MTLLVPAVELDERLSLRLVERELAEPGPGQVRLRVEWAGLCGSDLHVMRSGEWVTSWPAVLGHEISGWVEATGPGARLAEGTRVVADSRVPCGGCSGCLRDPDLCASPRFVGEACAGGFTSHCTLPERLLHPLPLGLDPAVAVLAEPLAVVLHALGQLRRVPERVLMLGHGPIGALTHLELLRRHAHVRVAVAEPVPLRGALAAALGAEVADDATAHRGEFDLVVDAAGHAGSLDTAVSACAAGATVLLVALGDRPVPVRPMELAERRIALIGSNAFTTELPDAVGLLYAEPWRYRPVITDAVALAELPSVARRHLEAPDAVKVLVRP